MTEDALLRTGVALAWIGGSGLALLWLYVLVQAWRRRRRQRPAWPQMIADTDYFQSALCRIFTARGYCVDCSWVIVDRIERQEREVVLALSRRGVLHAALCGRWVIPITSEIVTRFEEALVTTQAKRGLIVTTSYFTDAALQRAAGYPVELVDGQKLQSWIEEIW
jgi:hypothetical protein